MTECNQESFTFTAHLASVVQAEYTPGRVSSDAGALRLREADRKGHKSFWAGWRAVSSMAVHHCWSSTVCRRCWRSASMGWQHWATKRPLAITEQLRSDPLLGLS